MTKSLIMPKIGQRIVVLQNDELYFLRRDIEDIIDVCGSTMIATLLRRSKDKENDLFRVTTEKLASVYATHVFNLFERDSQDWSYEDKKELHEDSLNRIFALGDVKAGVTGCQRCPDGMKLMCHGNGGPSQLTSKTNGLDRGECTIVALGRKPHDSWEVISKNLTAKGFWVEKNLKRTLKVADMNIAGSLAMQIADRWEKAMVDLPLGKKTDAFIAIVDEMGVTEPVADKRPRWVSTRYSEIKLVAEAVRFHIVNGGFTGRVVKESVEARKLFVVNNCEAGCLSTPDLCGRDTPAYKNRMASCLVTQPEIDSFYAGAEGGREAVISKLSKFAATGRFIKPADIDVSGKIPYIVTVPFGDGYIVRKLNPNFEVAKATNRDVLDDAYVEGQMTSTGYRRRARNAGDDIASLAAALSSKTDDELARVYWNICVAMTEISSPVSMYMRSKRMSFLSDDQAHENEILALNLDESLEICIACDSKATVFNSRARPEKDENGKNIPKDRIKPAHRPRFLVKFKGTEIGTIRKAIRNANWRNPRHL